MNKNEKICINYQLRPKGHILRQFGSMDKCKHHLLIDGLHFSWKWINTKQCPFVYICKFYKDGFDNSPKKPNKS